MVDNNTPNYFIRNRIIAMDDSVSGIYYFLALDMIIESSLVITLFKASPMISIFLSTARLVLISFLYIVNYLGVSTKKLLISIIAFKISKSQVLISLSINKLFFLVKCLFEIRILYGLLFQ
jgi:hypothetical protein